MYGRSGISESYELKSAITGGGGGGGRTVSNADILSDPQKQHQVRSLVTQYDNGQLSKDAFRSRLLDAGIVETPEATRLLHASSLSLRAFLQALQSGNETLPSAATAPFGRPSDTTTPSVHHTSLASNIHGHAPTGKSREDKSAHVVESGVGLLLVGRGGELPPSATHPEPSDAIPLSHHTQRARVTTSAYHTPSGAHLALTGGTLLSKAALGVQMRARDVLARVDARSMRALEAQRALADVLGVGGEGEELRAACPGLAAALEEFYGGGGTGGGAGAVGMGGRAIPSSFGGPNRRANPRDLNIDGAMRAITAFLSAREGPPEVGRDEETFSARAGGTSTVRAVGGQKDTANAGHGDIVTWEGVPRTADGNGGGGGGGGGRASTSHVPYSLAPGHSEAAANRARNHPNAPSARGRDIYSEERRAAWRGAGVDWDGRVDATAPAVIALAARDKEAEWSGVGGVGAPGVRGTEDHFGGGSRGEYEGLAATSGRGNMHQRPTQLGYGAHLMRRAPGENHPGVGAPPPFATAPSSTGGGGGFNDGSGSYGGGGYSGSNGGGEDVWGPGAGVGERRRVGGGGAGDDGFGPRSFFKGGSAHVNRSPTGRGSRR